MRSLVWLIALGMAECRLTESFLMIKGIVLPGNPHKPGKQRPGITQPLKCSRPQICTNGRWPLKAPCARGHKAWRITEALKTAEAEQLLGGPGTLSTLTGQACGPGYGPVIPECSPSPPLFNWKGFALSAVWLFLHCCSLSINWKTRSS